MGRYTGSWLSGPRAATESPAVPGVRLGLPASGPGSVASAGARVGAFLVDLVASVLIGGVLVFVVRHPTLAQRNIAYDVAFFLQYVVLLSLTGQTIGMRFLGIRVIGNGGRPPAPGWVVVRTLLLLLLVPAVIWDRDQRGLHDKAAGTVVVRG